MTAVVNKARPSVINTQMNKSPSFDPKFSNISAPSYEPVKFSRSLPKPELPQSVNVDTKKYGDLLSEANL